MRYNPETIEHVRDMNPWQLAGLVDCYHDNPESELFLTSIRDAIIEQTEYTEPDDWEREIVEDYSDRRHEIADNAPNVYTSTMWSEFIGTRAWQWSDDVSDLEPSLAHGIENVARVHLYVIADRLAYALAEIIAGDIDDE